jgi:hypothetical protein
VTAFLRSLRSLLLGETWTIPIGVGASLMIAAVLRSALPAHLWHEGGGFVLAALVAATLTVALWSGR